jgi:hypothetical protein
MKDRLALHKLVTYGLTKNKCSGSGSRSFHQQAKQIENLDFYCLVTSL